MMHYGNQADTPSASTCKLKDGYKQSDSDLMYIILYAPLTTIMSSGIQRPYLPTCLKQKRDKLPEKAGYSYKFDINS